MNEDNLELLTKELAQRIREVADSGRYSAFTFFNLLTEYRQRADTLRKIPHETTGFTL